MKQPIATGDGWCKQPDDECNRNPFLFKRRWSQHELLRCLPILWRACVTQSTKRIQDIAKFKSGEACSALIEESIYPVFQKECIK